MKKSISIMIFLFTLGLSAQVKAPETDFILQNKIVYWQKTYEVAGKNASEIASSLKERFAGVGSDSLVASGENRYTFNVVNDKADIRKYGGKPFNTVTFAQLYLAYNGEIQIGENKYTVTLRNIRADNKDATEKRAGELSSFVCNTSNLTFKTDEGTRKGLSYLNSHFSDKFDVSKMPISENKATK